MYRTQPLPITRPDDMEKSRAWIGRFFAGPADLPISFALDGVAIHGIPDTWHPVSSRRTIDANIVETVFEGNDPNSGLHIRVEVTQYRDYPVIEWVAWFSNRGTPVTSILSDILALDQSFAGLSPVLDHCNGDFYSIEGYTPAQSDLSAGKELRFAPVGGRSCDEAFPYYRIRFTGGGLTMAIGWPGQWAAEFCGISDGVRVRTGQEKTSLRLLAGEQIRTPRMTVLCWAGDDSRAVNLWRRWYLVHVLPRPDGQPLKPMLACAATDEGEEFTTATEENQIRYIDRFQEEGIAFDVWWIDAGWYPCYNEDHVRRWWRTGSWEPDSERFPIGLKPISDRAAQHGADLLLWFEPERVQPGTKLDIERPQWLLKIPDNDNGLLNLGNPECRIWLTEHICQFIHDNGIKIYRQDHNFPPLNYWRSNEAEDRQGMNENLHIQGYLQFWDELLARNPGLWIDSCSSGGRRNDLETMRRSVPLHYTDYGYGDHPVKLAFQRTMYEWIPYFKEFTLSWDLSADKGRFDLQVDSYSYHCGMAAMLFATLDIRRQDYDFAIARKMIAIWRRASELILYGDYYPLTPFHRSDREWVVRQFDNPETGRGIVQAIRLPASTQETLSVKPHGIRGETVYFLENMESGERKDVRGEKLILEGLTFALPVRSGAIWFYQRRDTSLSD